MLVGLADGIRDILSTTSSMGRPVYRERPRAELLEDHVAAVAEGDLDGIQQRVQHEIVGGLGQVDAESKDRLLASLGGYIDL